MRRLAERSSSLRYSLYAALGLAAIVGARCGTDVNGVSAPPEVGVEATVSIHFKVRAGRVHRLAEGEQRLFRHVHASTTGAIDPRDRWVAIEVPVSRSAGVLARLQSDPGIERAFVAPEVSLPQPIAPSAIADDGASCPITTPSFESYQGYLGPAPQGIDAPAAWRRGARGQGVWFADVEGGWNANHEDLPGDRMTHAGGRPIADPMWRAHGTAVLGEVVARDNGKGVVGIAPDVDRVFTSSIGGTSVADALDTAAEQLRPGDVMLIELQATGPRGRFLPVEYWDDNFDAIKAATDRGVIVIEAAGNGGENLDHSGYRGKLDRTKRDSGAIMVGAGGPARDGFDDRARLDFSNYGSRVDVQGWGRKVATLDYGDLQRCDDGEYRSYVDRHYTDEFSGTSSASPIVAGAAVLVQSYAKARGRTLSPSQVRQLLRTTGTPQTSDPAQQIGPRPDLAKALPAIGSGSVRSVTTSGQSAPDDVIIDW
jgi:subtilisin family serine protease